MLGHLVSNYQQDAPNFGIAAFLRKTGIVLPIKPRRILSLLSRIPRSVLPPQ